MSVECSFDQVFEPLQIARENIEDIGGIRPRVEIHIFLEFSDQERDGVERRAETLFYGRTRATVTIGKQRAVWDDHAGAVSKAASRPSGAKGLNKCRA